MLQQERMSREERAQITPRCFGFHVSRSLRKRVRVLRRGVKIHRKGIFLDKHIRNQIAGCGAHGRLRGWCSRASPGVPRVGAWRRGWAGAWLGGPALWRHGVLPLWP